MLITSRLGTLKIKQIFFNFIHFLIKYSWTWMGEITKCLKYFSFLIQLGLIVIKMSYLSKLIKTL